MPRHLSGRPSKGNPGLVTIAITTEYMLAGRFAARLEEHLEQYADDRNGDGRWPSHCNIPSSRRTARTDYDAAQLQASSVKFAADASNADSIIFIYDDASYEYLDNNDMEGFFAPVDGSGRGVRALLGYGGAQQPGAQPLRGGGQYRDGDERARQAHRAVRAEDGTAFEKAEKVEYRQDSIAMFERLKNDEKNRSSGGISRKAGGCAGSAHRPLFSFDTAAYWRYNRAILWPCGPACVRPRGRPQSGRRAADRKKRAPAIRGRGEG